MSDQRDLLKTLRHTSELIAAVRKMIAASGQLDTMLDIDTLLAVAQTDADRRIAVAVSQAARRSRP